MSKMLFFPSLLLSHFLDLSQVPPTALITFIPLMSSTDSTNISWSSATVSVPASTLTAWAEPSVPPGILPALDFPVTYPPIPFSFTPPLPLA